MTNQTDHLLVVDDEANIRLTLNALLTRAGYAVTMAANGEEAIALMDEHVFHLLLVDLKMPGIDGMQVVAAARERFPHMSILVLTGHGSLETAVEGLHMGIFDYLLKTTDPAQVVERVQAGLEDYHQKIRQHALLDTVSSAVQELRQSGTGSQNQPPSQVHQSVAALLGSSNPGAPDAPSERIISVGELQIDTWRQAATFAGRTLPLTPTEFRVLLCLSEHVGKMLTYTQIVRCAQGYESSEPEASELIKPHIYHLRQKLEPDPATPRYVLNVRGKGYMLQI
ncbi:MAG: response regulator transcription factor [Blastochloris sp.]|nr:response regulator transcription factor [Blastochloris sp.]